MFNFSSFSPQKSQSHFLIVLCFIVSFAGFYFDGLKFKFGLHSNVFDFGIFGIISQSLLFQFLHSDILHLFFNLYFLYFVGPEVEARMSKNNFIYFFVFNLVFCVIALSFFTKNSITIGISGFCLALLSYVVLDLKSVSHYSFGNFAFLLIFNLSTGIFISGISFVGHLAGAVAGAIWWIIFKKFKILKK